MLRRPNECTELKIVADQIGAPTSAALATDITVQLIQIYLADGKHGPFDAYQLAQLCAVLVEQAGKLGLPLTLTPDALHDIPTEASRCRANV